MTRIPGQSATFLVALLLIVAACGDEDATTSQFFEESPTCPPNAAEEPSFRIVGPVGGIEAGVEQTGSGASGGFSQLDGGQLQVGRFVVDTNPELAGVELTWDDAIISGSARAVTGGRLQLPDSHPAGGQVLCVTQGVVGVPASESSASIVFSITGLRTGEACDGNAVTAGLRGCWGSGTQ